MRTALIDTLKALADPLRLRMLAILRREELAVSELAQVLGVNQPRISHHIKTLRECGLIRIRREGAWTFCRPATDGDRASGLFEAMKPWAGELTPDNQDLDNLERVLEERRQRSLTFFEEAAGRWETMEPRFEGSGIRHQALSALVPPGLVVADIGCGAGFMTRVLATRARKVILVDHSPAMVDRAREHLGTSLAAELEFRVGDLTDPPLAPTEVDALFVNMVLHHVADLQGTLTALAAALRPGGALVISDLLPHEEESLREDQADLRLGLDPENLADLAGRSGFHRIRTEKGVDRLRTRGQGGRELSLPLFVLQATRESQVPKELISQAP